MFTRTSCLILAAFAALLVPSSKVNALPSSLKTTPSAHQHTTVQSSLHHPDSLWTDNPSILGNPRVEVLPINLKIAQSSIEATENEVEQNEAKRKEAEMKYWVLEGIAGVLLRMGQIDRVVQLLRSIPKEDLSGALLVNAVGQYSNPTQVSAILDIANRLEASKQVAVLLTATDYLSQAGQPHPLEAKIRTEALALAETLPVPQQKVYASLVATHYLQSQERYQQALEWSQKIDDGEGKHEVLQAIGQALADAEQFSKGLHLLQTLETGREQASMLLPIVLELIEKGQLDRAWQAIQLVEEFASQDLWYVNDLVTRFAETGQFSKALEVARTIETADDKARALHQISRQAMVAGKMALAEQLRAEALALLPAIESACCRVLLLAGVSLDRVKSGQVAEGLALARTIAPADHRFEALEDIATYLTETERKQRAEQIWTEALEVARSIPEADRRFEALRKLADRFKTSGQRVLATQLQAEAFQVLEAGEDEEKASAIASLTQESYPEQTPLPPQEYAWALELAQTIANDEAKAEALISLASRMTETEHYQQLLQSAQTIRDPQHQTSVLLAIASSSWAEKQPERLQETVVLLLKVMPNTISHGDSIWQLFKLADLLYNLGQPKQASQLLQKLPTGNSKNVVFFEAIYDLISAGDIDRAIQQAEAFQDETAKQEAFVAIALRLIEERQHKQTLQLIETVSNPWLAAGIWAQLAEQYLDNGETNKAVEAIDRAFALIDL